MAYTGGGGGYVFQSLGILKSIEFTSWENLSLKYLSLIKIRKTRLTVISFKFIKRYTKMIRRLLVQLAIYSYQ